MTARAISCSAKIRRLARPTPGCNGSALANLDWLVVRDLMIESATCWHDGPEIETEEMRTEDIGTEVFFLPAAAHTEKDGKLHQHPAACCNGTTSGRAGRGRAQRPVVLYHLGRRIREKLAASTDEMDRPVLDLTWEYPVEGPQAEPSPTPCWRRSTAGMRGGGALGSYTELTTTGDDLWLLDLLRFPGRGSEPGGPAQAGSEQSWVAPEWGWAWPANRRLLYNRASADPDGRPWSDRKALRVVGRPSKKIWTGHDVADFVADRPPDYEPPAPRHAAPPTPSEAGTPSSCSPI